MRSLLVSLLCLSSGCVFIFDGDDSGDDLCALREDTSDPAIAPAPLRDPGDLLCEAFGSGCDPACGPCPAATELAVAPIEPIPPIPSWPICGHPCEGQSESACSADPQCRVVKSSSCTFGPAACLTDYVGCFPIDTVADPEVDCFAADAWECSRSNRCTAYHSYEACPFDGECPRPFDLCVPEGRSPGQCAGEITCRQLPPPCAAGTVPGIENGCYTGACIPQHLCGQQP